MALDGAPRHLERLLAGYSGVRSVHRAGVALGVADRHAEREPLLLLDVLKPPRLTPPALDDPALLLLLVTHPPTPHATPASDPRPGPPVATRASVGAGAGLGRTGALVGFSRSPGHPQPQAEVLAPPFGQRSRRSRSSSRPRDAWHRSSARVDRARPVNPGHPCGPAATSAPGSSLTAISRTTSAMPSACFVPQYPRDTLTR